VAAKEKILCCWSGGKDCALALHEILRSDEFEVAALLTTLTEDYQRVSMHGVRVELLEMQAGSLNLPLEKVWIPRDADEDTYESRMREVLEKQRSTGVTKVAFGDIFLEDVRRHREEKLAEIGITAIFPLWGRDTDELARAFIREGFEAILTCVDTQQLEGCFTGRAVDEKLLADLPHPVDPCGENGEFHTFVHTGPIFRCPIPYRTGETVLRDDRFCFCDVIVDP
jgi:uncharacterized protein (TIGR00290 family)